MRICPPTALWLALTAVPSWAEITLDGSLGPAGAVMPGPENEIKIEAGMGRQAGSNLFHSFGVFNVNAGETATFNDTGATGPVENILSRVTGGRSEIDGTIRTSFQSSDPNLFLLNPAGVVFGPNAELKVEGSFHASTGDFIELVDGVQFTATPSPNDALLSTAPPEAFGFLGNNQAGIEVEGARLQVGSGKSLSVVAPNVNVDGGEQNNGLFAGPAGTVNIVSIEGPGEAQIGGGRVTLPTDQSRGRIVITNGVIGSVDLRTDGSHINIIGGDVEISRAFVVSNSVDAPGRGIEVVADNLRLNEAQFFALALANGRGGDVQIDADREIRLDSNSVIDTESFGLGQAGDIFISADMLDMSGLSLLNASGMADGPAGDITIQASGDVRLSGNSRMFAPGAGGNISVTANNLRMEDGAVITTATFSGEQAGGITLEVADTIALTGDLTLITSRSLGAGKAGDINIKTSNLNLAEGAKITGEALGLGSGAEILIDGLDGTVSLSGPSTSITSETIGDGDAGRVAIRTGRLTVRDGAAISASTRGNGKGGSVNIQAANIELLDGGAIAARSTSTSDSAESGSLSIRADDTIRIFNGSSINVETAQAKAGDITLKAGFLLHLKGKGEVSTSARGGAGDGGDIFIDPVFTVLDEGSRITARAFRGRGGNIAITTNFLFQSPDSIINASSQFGVSGNVDIDSPDTDVISSALELPASFLDAASLLSDRCSARTQKGASSFIVSGPGGVPPGPETVLPSYSLNLSEAPKINQGATAISADRLCNR